MILTPRESAVLAILRAHKRDGLPPPTIRELCAAIGISQNSKQWIQHLLNALEAKRAIDIDRRLGRGIRVRVSLPFGGRIET